MVPVRTFIAVDLSPSIRQAIQTKINDLRQLIGDSVRWSQAGNIHLTLKFLGDVPPPEVDKLIHMVQETAGSHAVFDVSPVGLGSFPNSKRPRVLFIGIQAPKELEALQSDIESAVSGLGYKTDSRPFSPHLTIGRVRDRLPPQALRNIRRALEETKIDSLGTVRVDSVHLYKSELFPGGPVYTAIFSAHLQAADMMSQEQ